MVVNFAHFIKSSKQRVPLEPVVKKMPKNYKRLIKNILKSPKIISAHRKTLRGFEKHQREEGVCDRTRLEYLYILRQFALKQKVPFEELTKDELVHYVMDIRQRTKKQSSADLNIQRIRRFFKWLYDPDDLEFPDLVKGPAFKERPKNTKAGGTKKEFQLKKEDLLTSEEVTAIIESADHPMYQAIYAAMIATGARVIRELLSIQIQDVTLEEDQYKIQIWGTLDREKEDQPEREALGFEGVYYLKLWLSLHPRRFDPTAYVFYAERSGKYPLPENTLRDHLTRDVEVAAQTVPSLKTKRMYLHLWRHTAATVWAAKPNMTIFALNQQFGWSQGSRMAQKYVHLATEDVEDVVRIAHGLEPKGEVEVKKLIDTVQIPRKEYAKLQTRVEELEAQTALPRVDLGLVKTEMEAELQRFKDELRADIEKEFTKFKTEQEDA